MAANLPKVQTSLESDKHLNKLVTDLSEQVSKVAVTVAKAQQQTSPVEVNSSHIEDAYFSIIKGHHRGILYRIGKTFVSLVSAVGIFMAFLGIKGSVPDNLVPLFVFGGGLVAIAAHITDAYLLDK